MFKEGHLYCFSQFKFNNGDLPKDKYFIVLKETKDEILIGTLPTRNNKIPSFVTIEHGCINIEERMYNCYMFQEKRPICTNGECFELPTFIYGGEIEYYVKSKLISDFPVAGKNFIEVGKLTEQEFTDILDCFINSGSVKRGIKRQLTAR